MEIEIENFTEIDEIHSDCGEIVSISADQLTYNQFFYEFMTKNIPVVIKNVKLLTPTSFQWVDANGRINIDCLRETLQDESAPVYNCSKQYFNSHEKTSMTFNEFADYWESSRESLIYLKDFHLKQQRPDLDFYDVPKFFASDWLNEYLVDKERDDYRFVYLGTKGTWTPLHADVFGSYSWSVNVSGKKRWLFLPPVEEDKLRNNHNQLPFSIDEDFLRERGAKYFVLIQEANDAIFVPSQWYHQVENQTDVLSFNHNWFNSCNITSILDNLLKNYEDVKREIDDCCDMENFEEHCQLMLNSLFGLNFEGFIDIMAHISDKRLEQIKTAQKITLFETFQLGHAHATHDLQTIDKVLNRIMNLEEIDANLRTRTREIISKINHI